MIIDIIKNYQGKCVIDLNNNYSFEDLIFQIENYKNELKNIIIHNDNVAVISDYNFYSVSLIIYLSSLKINIIPLVKTTHDEINLKLDQSKPTKIIEISKDGLLSVKILKQYLNPFDNNINSYDSGIVLFSSGTSGKPKMMLQNLSELIRNIKVPRKQKKLSFIIFLIFDHIGGLNTLLNCIISGTPIVIPKDRKPSTIIDLINQNEVNILPTTPTFLNLMLMDENFSEKKLKSLKLISYGTERMPESLLKKLNKFFPKVKLLQTFGTSETGILKTKSKSSNSLYFKIIDDDKEFKVVENELYLKSKTNIKGYINHENSNFKNDGWFATGDIVEEDKEGYFKIIGRKNKLINVGGLKVFPSEVEEVINSINEVTDSIVFSKPNSITGQIVCAKVFSNSNDLKSLKIKIKKLCKFKLEKYKVPVKIIFSKLELNLRGKKKQ